MGSFVSCGFCLPTADDDVLFPFEDSRSSSVPLGVAPARPRLQETTSILRLQQPVVPVISLRSDDLVGKAVPWPASSTGEVRVVTRARKVGLLQGQITLAGLESVVGHQACLVALMPIWVVCPVPRADPGWDSVFWIVVLGGGH